jgi:hypothetical protein
MADLQGFLGKLLGVQGKAPKWRAICPAHENQNGTRSLAIKDAGDGRILIKCFAGCGAVDVVGAVGMELSDLMPDRALDQRGPMRAPFLPSDAFDVLRREVLVAWVIVQQTRNGGEVDHDRLTQCANRLDAIGAACYGRE